MLAQLNGEFMGLWFLIKLQNCNPLIKRPPRAFGGSSFPTHGARPIDVLFPPTQSSIILFGPHFWWLGGGGWGWGLLCGHGVRAMLK